MGEQVWVRNNESHFGHVELDWAWETAKWRRWERKSLGSLRHESDDCNQGQAWGTLQTGDERWTRENPEGHPYLRWGQGGRRGKTGKEQWRGIVRKPRRLVPIDGLENIQEGDSDGEADVCEPDSRGLWVGPGADFLAAFMLSSCFQCLQPQASFLLKHKTNKQNKSSFRKEFIKILLMTV